MYARHIVLALLLTVAPPATGQVVRDAGSQANASTAALPMQEIIVRLTRLADSLVSRDQFAGVILLAHQGAPVFERAYGLADRSTQRPNTVESSFNVSSIGKQFTQTAIRQLASQGRLHLDSTIAAYWPDYPNAAVARQVTIRHLLDHRSGITGNIFQRLTTLRNNRDYFPAFVASELAFPPGSRQEYSNAGYVVLGEIIARVSGLEYRDYLQRHVFAPAGMTQTGFPSLDSLPPHASIGYSRMAGNGAPPAANAPLRPNTELQPMRGSAAGGSYATARDLLRLIVAQRDGTLSTGAGGRGGAAFGGGSPGSNGSIALGLPGGYDLIVLANMDPPSAGVIERAVGGWFGSAATGGVQVERGPGRAN